MRCELSKPLTVLKKEDKDKLQKEIFSPKKIPLFSQIAKDWLENKRPNVRETTWEALESHIRNHFNELDGLKINRITTATLEKFITTRQDQGMNINTLTCYPESSFYLCGKG